MIEIKSDVNEAVHKNFWPGYTPLHFAIKFQCLETDAFLLRIGANINIKDGWKLTALHLADMTRNEPMIDLLLTAHKTISSNPVNAEGLTHFHIACTRNNPEIVKCFFESSVYIPPHPYKSKSSAYNCHGMSPLDMALYYECVDVVELLLMHCYTLPFKQLGKIT
ncbi:hypothetical protein QAD02_016968 [Eretmocerus hayati]|uniref:Uncharacterized protein n=1 Tax=Eretmocerus hayati TaxID=131215 RepID=A0ACC2PDT9_9HYME|nr:hypothetical protein QAD02_016968 [Eretmocerus hayati]